MHTSLLHADQCHMDTSVNSLSRGVLYLGLRLGLYLHSISRLRTKFREYIRFMDLPLIEYVATQSQIRLFFRATLSSDFLYIAALLRQLCNANASPLFLIYTGLLSMY